MKTAMTLLIEYLKENKDTSIDAIVEIATELRHTVEKETLIRSYIGFFDETVSQEELQEAYKAGYAFYRVIFGDSYTLETEVKEETQG